MTLLGAHFNSLTLRTLTPLNREVKPFCLSDNSIWSLPRFLPLAIAAFGGPEGYFSLAIIAFGALAIIVPKYNYRLGKKEVKESRLLIQGGHGLQGCSEAPEGGGHEGIEGRGGVV